eukprot:PRCOL_00001636-RA
MANDEVLVCTNKACKRQGSRDTLHWMQQMAPEGVSVSGCGCLGKCGAGPNTVVLPLGLKP